jgi:hypothetical protein
LGCAIQKLCKNFLATISVCDTLAIREEGSNKNMDSQKLQVAERIKQANNILVTVSSNPSVDQLAACIGLTLSLNKMGKHATAVFSGTVPSTIEFLQPEKTIEKNTDSLRDFIIALDKSKADKLRYKVEDKVVKIFITPYKTSISEKDLEFSQGDFNVDVVLALGVHDQADLDQAITAHGRILHDATVMSINLRPGGEVGSINWINPDASSLAELGVQLVDTLDKKLVDNQIATAFLTGIVAETERFSNEKTSPQTMSISAELMSAGANQQLVATKLEEPLAPPAAPEAMHVNQQTDGTTEPAEKKPNNDGTLEINHGDKPNVSQPIEEPKPEEPPENITPQIHIDDQGGLQALDKDKPSLLLTPTPTPVLEHPHNDGPHLVLQPPTFASQLTASTTPTGFPADDSMDMPQAEPDGPLLDRQPLQTPSIGTTIMPPANSNDNKPLELTPANTSDAMPVLPPAPSSTANSEPSLPPAPTPAPAEPSFPVEPPKPAIDTHQTLSEIERDVNSNHLNNDNATSPPPLPPMPTPTYSSPPAITLPPMPPAADTTENNFSSPPAPAAFTPAPAAPWTPPPADASPTAFNPAAFTDAVDQGTPPPAPGVDVNSARDAVTQAINGAAPAQLEPIQALNAQSLGSPLHVEGSAPADGALNIVPPTPLSPDPLSSMNPSMPPMPAPGMSGMPDTSGQGMNPNSPPPVPPPMLPPVQPL